MENWVNPSVGARKSSRANSTRTCAACQEEAAPLELVRFVRAEDGSVFPDLKASNFGRGAWLHPRPECLKKLQPALSRSFRAQVRTTSTEAIALLSQAASVRVWQLLGAARRERKVKMGGTLVEEAYREGKAALLIVARDARAAAGLPSVEQAISQGGARVWGTKDELGQLFGRPEVGVLAILDKRLAAALFDAIALALLAAGADVERRPGRIQWPENDGFAEVE